MTNKRHMRLSDFRVYFIPIVMMSMVSSNQVIAQGTPTFLSNDRDLVRLDGCLGGGFPGRLMSSRFSLLRTQWSADAWGMQMDATIDPSKNSFNSLLSLEAVWEHSWAWFDGYRGMRLRAGAGPVLLEPTAWEVKASVSAAYDEPLADLMWARVGTSLSQTFVLGMKPTVVVYLGFVAGGQWLGLGD